jgi:hypothetical protein
VGGSWGALFLVGSGDLWLGRDRSVTPRLHLVERTPKIVADGLAL